MGNMKLNGILVLVEHRDNEVESITWQLLNKGRQLADQLGVELGALILGHDIGTIADSIDGRGVDKVITADSPELTPYNPEIFTKVLADFVRDANPMLILLGYTFLGMEIGPAMATRLGIPLVSNCIDIELSPERLPTITRPMYGETVHVRMEGSLPLIVSVQKGMTSSKVPSTGQAKLNPIDVIVNRDSLRTRVVDIIRPNVGEVDFKKADVIVAVGRGIGQATNIELARKLAKALGGVIAGSRPVIDMGWLPPEYQIGLSGHTVSPKVYIACGISGAAQHVAGMVDSQMIIAINRDPNAPIFNAAHYAVVGDLFEVVPALIDATGKQA